MIQPSTTGAFVNATLLAGLIAGALDIIAAILQNLQVGAEVVLQAVASGWLGAAAYQGGWPAAWLGLGSHFGLMMGIAAIFVLMALLQPALRRLWIPAGAAWGVIVWAAMTYGVVPLSAATLPPPDAAAILMGLATHIVAVGLPIAFIARRVLGPAAKA